MLKGIRKIMTFLLTLAVVLSFICQTDPQIFAQSPDVTDDEAEVAVQSDETALPEDEQTAEEGPQESKEAAQEEVTKEETDEFFGYLRQNLETNVLTIIREHPDVEFYLFFPPYSICWWDTLNQKGTAVLERRIDMEKYAIEKMLQYENVRLFSFFNKYDLICNLDNYVDDIHYTGDVNNLILQWMKSGEYELTKENYEDYIAKERAFYTSYDYDQLFGEQQ